MFTYKAPEGSCLVSSAFLVGLVIQGYLSHNLYSQLFTPLFMLERIPHIPIDGWRALHAIVAADLPQILPTVHAIRRESIGFDELRANFAADWIADSNNRAQFLVSNLPSNLNLWRNYSAATSYAPQSEQEYGDIANRYLGLLFNPAQEKFISAQFDLMPQYAVKARFIAAKQKLPISEIVEPGDGARAQADRSELFGEAIAEMRFFRTFDFLRICGPSFFNRYITFHAETMYQGTDPHIANQQFAEIFTQATKMGFELYTAREAFISKEAYQTLKRQK